jgi:transcriptional regulator with XRE-family HTH domain
MDKRDRSAELQRAFGNRLRDLRGRSGISQMELAHRANLHPTYISSVERGRRNVSLVNIHALADALEVNVRDLFPQSRPRA